MYETFANCFQNVAYPLTKSHKIQVCHKQCLAIGKMESLSQKSISLKYLPITSV